VHPTGYLTGVNRWRNQSATCPPECGILGVVADNPPRNEFRLGGFIPVTEGV